jgi:putative membrane protein
MHWLHAKLTLVLVLFAYHGMCGRLVRQFAHDQNTRSHVFYRWFNEFPVLILIAVIILAIVKPL